MNSNNENEQVNPYIINYMERFFAFSEILKETNGKGAKRVLKALMGHPFEEPPQFMSKNEANLFKLGTEMKELLNVLGVQYVIQNEVMKQEKKEGEAL